MKKKTEPFIHLSWDDLRKWAGSKIVSRGQSYQCQNRVSKLAMLDDGGLIAWVDGSNRYATQVTINEDGLPESICTCPYGCDCKHGVAVVLEYLEQIKKNKCVAKAGRDDERLLLFNEDEWNDNIDDEDEYDDESPSMKNVKSEINAYLNGKTKAQLTEMLYELAEKFPQLAQELTDCKKIASGDIKSLIKRLKKDICEISSEPGWQNYWKNEGYTPDYSEIHRKMETLLKAGHPDEVLVLGKELIDLGNQQIGMSHDEGETAMEIEDCMPVIVKALAQSSLNKADKLAWAVDVVLKDDYDTFNAFSDYLCRRHAKADWSILADRLLKQLDEVEYSGDLSEFSRNYDRDRFTDRIIHALEQADRREEIVPLCEAEVQKTGSYSRLVNYLISEKQYAKAEDWIQKGIRATEERWPGIASDLRNRLKEIRIVQKDWIAAATMETEEFIRYPSARSFIVCQKANKKTKTWPKVREHLFIYLEKGVLPWKQKGWPLGQVAEINTKRKYQQTFPIAEVLIDIAIHEKNPERVLFWYDQQLENHKQGWSGVDDDKVAKAIQDYAPERSVSIWKAMAEALIAHTEPKAYGQAVGFLNKAEKIMKREKKQDEWNRYLNGLKEKHARKRRFLEILDQSSSKPIVNPKG